MSTAELVTKRATLVCTRKYGRGIVADIKWTNHADHFRSLARAELAQEQDSYLSRLPESARQHFMAWYEPRMDGRDPTDALIALAIRTATEEPHEHGLLIAEVFGDDDAAEAADIIVVILSDLDRDAEAVGEAAPDTATPHMPMHEILAHFAGMGDKERAGTTVTFNIEDRTFELRCVAPGRVAGGKIIGMLVEKVA